MKKTSGCRWKRLKHLITNGMRFINSIEHCDKVEKSLAETLKLSYEDFLIIIVAEIKAGIVHFGVGNFHRAHLEAYTNLLLEDPSQKMLGGIQSHDYAYGRGLVQRPQERRRHISIDDMQPFRRTG